MTRPIYDLCEQLRAERNAADESAKDWLEERDTTTWQRANKQMADEYAGERVHTADGRIVDSAYMGILKCTHNSLARKYEGVPSRCPGAGQGEERRATVDYETMVQSLRADLATVTAERDATTERVTTLSVFLITERAAHAETRKALDTGHADAMSVVTQLRSELAKAEARCAGQKRRAPVQGNRRIKRGEPGHEPGTVTWEDHERAWHNYAKRYGRDQSAERISERGGFGYLELTDHLGHAPTTWEPSK